MHIKYSFDTCRGNKRKMAKPVIGHLREFDADTNDWTIFVPRLNNYFEANAVAEDEKKRAIFLNLLSENSYRLMFNLCLPEAPEKKSFAQLVKVFNQHFQSQSSVFPERFKFYTARKNPSESIQEWAAKVRSLAVRCEFTTELQVVLRDMFIVGMGRGKVLDRLMEEKNTISFDDAIKIATAKESALQNFPPFHIKEEPLHHIRSIQTRPKAQSSTSQHSNKVQGIVAPFPCKVCGRRNHTSQQCRYKDKFCNICKLKGHLAPVCFNKNRETAHNYSRGGSKCKNNYLETDLAENFEYSLWSVESCETVADKSAIEGFLLTVFIDNQQFKFQVDTGAGISCISQTFYEKYFKKFNLLTTGRELCLYNGSKINPTGYLNLKVKFKDVEKEIEFLVIKNGGPPLLGRNFLVSFNVGLTELYCNDISNDSLVSKLLDENISLFEDNLGTFNKDVAKIALKSDNVTPKFIRCRPLPYALKEKVEEELNRLLKMNVIAPVDYSAWATPIVPVMKSNGTIRLCCDFKITINPYLEIPEYPLPRPEELFAKLSGGNEFSKIDLTNAYQQILLDDNSKRFVTISTHKGLFQFQRLPFGIASGPAIFQKIMESLLQGQEGVSVFLDDIIITAPSRELHLNRLRDVFKILGGSGFKISKEKCVFLQKSVTYLGYVIDKRYSSL